MLEAQEDESERHRQNSPRGSWGDNLEGEAVVQGRVSGPLFIDRTQIGRFGGQGRPDYAFGHPGHGRRERGWRRRLDRIETNLVTTLTLTLTLSP